MVKRIFRVLLMSGVLGVFTTTTHAAQAPEQGSVRESHQERKSIVGSWMGTFENGERILMSFTSDGIVLSSVQTEVSSTNPVLTPGHGVWIQVGKRQFAITDIVILYDIQTGEYRGAGKLRGLLTLDEAGNLDGNTKVEIFDLNGNLAITFPHPFRLTRITVDSLD
jgi:hypothetical protein